MTKNSKTQLIGKVKLNGDKSISHRVAMISGLSNGITKIENFSSSADCSSTLECLKNLGVEIERDESSVLIKGVGKKGLRESNNNLDCGNSGSTMRMISGILAGQNFSSVLIGDESLTQRPMKRIIEPLELMGAKISAEENHAPLQIQGKNPLQAIDYVPNVASAQVKSCVLLAGLFADGTTTYLEKTPTRDHTERMLNWFGANISSKNIDDAKKISVSGDSELTARDFTVPSDISSSAFFLVAASCLNGSDLILENIGLNPTRAAIIDILKNLGANIEIVDLQEKCNEPVGNLRIIGNDNLFPKEQGKNIIRGSIISNLIDELPILAVFGTQIESGLEVRDAKELRVKESDRIKAVVENLKAMKADVEEFEDGFRVGKSNLQGATINSFGDHRIAMAFTVASLLADGETKIIDADCAKVSFPEFYDLLESVKK